VSGNYQQDLHAENTRGVNFNHSSGGGGFLGIVNQTQNDRINRVVGSLVLSVVSGVTSFFVCLYTSIAVGLYAGAMKLFERSSSSHWENVSMVASGVLATFTAIVTFRLAIKPTKLPAQRIRPPQTPD